MEMRRVGYIRVSSVEQNEARQRSAMRRQNLMEADLFVDKQSGQNFDRPAYGDMLSQLAPGDVVYVLSVDRLGRNYGEIQEEWRRITKDIGADIVVLDMPLLDTRQGKDLMGTFVADLVLQILSFVSHNEWENIHKRQRQGIDAAKKRGVRFGRPKRRVPACFPDLCLLWVWGRISLKEGARLARIPRSTFRTRLHRYIREHAKLLQRTPAQCLEKRRLRNERKNDIGLWR